MKITGLTDHEDYHLRAILWCACHGSWNRGVDWRDWDLNWEYVWFDGPNWFLQVGPFWVGLRS